MGFYIFAIAVFFAVFGIFSLIFSRFGFTEEQASEAGLPETIESFFE